MKKFVAYFIRYPISVNTLMATIGFFGLLAMFSLNSTFFPIVESRFISIQAIYPGASPEEIEEGIVQKIEENLKGTSGVERITSISSENAANITVEILKGYNTAQALEDVKNAVNSIPSFPAGMEPIVVFKRENLTFTIEFSISGKNVSLHTLKEVARNVEANLQTAPGISKVSLSGFPDEEIEIALNEEAMRAYQITFEQIATAISSENLEITGGLVKGEVEELLVRARNKSYFGRDLENITIISRATGERVLLKDIAEIRDQFEDKPGRLVVNGDPAVRVTVQNTDDEDMLATADYIKEYVEQFNLDNPALSAKILRDASKTLKDRRTLLMKNGVIGFFLVLIFLALFLNRRVAFWVAIGIPISFLGMFILASYAGVTINVVSLFGMIVVVGILVDDGIVISENIYQQYEKGKSPIRAALDGTLEVFPAVLSAILTTIVAFSTFYFLDGRAGDFFSEMGFVVMATLAASLIEAALFLPAHLAHSRALKTKQRSKFEKAMDNIVRFLRERIYAPSLRYLLEHRFFGLMIPVGLLIITIGAFKGSMIKVTFFPFIERDNIEISIDLPSGTRREVTWDKLEYIYQKAQEVNEEYSSRRDDGMQLMQDVSMEVGPLAHQGKLVINLLDAELRLARSYDVANSVREKVGQMPELENASFGNAGAFGRPVSVSLLGNDHDELEAAKEELKAYMKSLSSVKDVTDSDLKGSKEVLLDLKSKAQLLGMNTAYVLRQVRQGFFGLEVQRIQRGEDEVKVWLRYDEKDRSTIRDLEELRIISPQGERIPLGELATLQLERGVISINHLDGKQEIKVEADLSDPSESAPDIIASIREDFIDKELLPKYSGISTLYEGQNREATKTADSSKRTLPFILVGMILIITFTFRSFFQTMAVFLLIPLTLTGVAWGHYVHGITMSVFSFLGVIALIGILVNDSLVLVSKFNGNLKAGSSVDEAIYEAGISRFRAIFLTSATTIAGLAPLILEKSFQAQFLVPMAIAVAYGIAFATLLTLITLPILLSYLNSFRRIYTWLLTGTYPSAEIVETAVAEMKDENEEI